jgi:dTDP-4-dehydrorhamnose 3,5-epimerase
LKRIDTKLPGVVILEPEVFQDDRGDFFETYHQGTLSKLGINAHFVQENQSRSRKGVLRGLHYQLMHPQAKLCRVISGEVWDVVVDIRTGSPTFGRWDAIELSGRAPRQVYIPKGLAHGFVVRSEWAEFVYKCDDFYHPEDEYGVRWNDQQLSIDWGEKAPLMSSRDANYPPLASIKPERLPRYEL